MAEKKKKESIKKKESKAPKKKETSKKESTEEKIIKTVIIVCAIAILLVLIFKGISTQVRYHDYKGVQFETISDEGKMLFQHTMIDVMINGKLTPYNFYLRTPIKALKKVPFENIEDFDLMKIMGFRMDTVFDCEGDQTIAMANLINLVSQTGMTPVKDNNATCDERYNLFILEEGEKTQITEISPRCYKVEVANCEILPATEKIMAEIFVKYNQL